MSEISVSLEKRIDKQNACFFDTLEIKFAFSLEEILIWGRQKDFRQTMCPEEGMRCLE